jgi:hypothetical protein
MTLQNSEAAQGSKTGARRLVKIEPNLAAWLQAYAQLSGSVTPSCLRQMLEEARKAAGIKRWPPNALRHSYASYHLANFKNAATTALELGHTNASITFKHYRELVKPAEAERYWNLRPSVSAAENPPQNLSGDCAAIGRPSRKRESNRQASPRIHSHRSGHPTPRSSEHSRAKKDSRCNAG